MTPEGKVKKLVKAVLERHNIIAAKDAGNDALVKKANGWYFMPSQNGMGVKGIPDFLGHVGGVFFSVETKAEGEAPTGFQQLQLELIGLSGGAVFIIDGLEGVTEFETWVLGNLF